MKRNPNRLARLQRSGPELVPELRRDAAKSARDIAKRAQNGLNPIFRIALAASLLSAIYWGFIASDRYVSEARIIIQKTNSSADSPSGLSQLLSTAGGGSDQLLLRDHLLSMDMLIALDQQLKLREHFSNWRRDPISRIWFSTMPMEKFQAYFASRASVDFDEYSGVLIVRAEAFDAETAHAIAEMMVSQGESHMNKMAHSLAAEQVAFLEQQVVNLNERVTVTRRKLIDFQNRNGISSPQAAAQSVEAIIGKLEAQSSDLQTQRGTLLGYLVPGSPAVRELDLQLEAVNRQIESERKRLASNDGETLNRTIEAYQVLEQEAAFTQDLYRSALAALEQGRIESTRMLKKVSILQSPTMPEYPLEPRRTYNAVVFLIVSLLMAGVVNLIIVIVRDHRD